MKNVFLRLVGLCLLLCALLPVKEAFAALSTGCQAVNTKGSYTGSDIYWQQINGGYTFSTGETLKITFSNPTTSGQTAHINAGTSAAVGVPASFSSKASSSSFPATLTYTLDQDYTYVKFNITSGNVDMTDMECRKSQVITFNDPGAQQLSSGTATLTASSDSGLTVSLASSTAGVCTVSGTTLSLVSAGTCTITASQAGNSPAGDYFAATDVSRSFSVTASSGGGGGEEEEEEEAVENIPTPVDNVRPVVKVSVLGLESDARTSQPSWRVAIEISEVVTGLDIDDFLLSNLTISEFSGSGREFSALVSSVTPGRSSISVPEDGCQDNANNLNLESNSVSWRYEPDLLLNKSVTAVARAYTSLAQEYLRNFSQPINSRFARLGQAFGRQIATEACQSDESEGQPEIPGCNQDDIDSGDINSYGLSYQGIQFTFRDPVMRSIFSGQPDKADPRGLLPDLETLINSPSEIDSSKELIGRVIGATLAATDLEPVDLNPSGDASTAGWSIWTEGQVTVGNWDSVDSSDGVLIAIGSDRAVGDYARGGVALTASWQSAEINPNDDVDAENYGLSFYGAMRPKEMALVLEGILGAADLDIASTRKETSATFSADRDGTMLFSSIGVRGLEPVGRKFKITPHGRFELGSAKIDTESETGGVWAVQYGDQNIDHQMLFIGLDINYHRALPKGLIRPFGSAEYGYSFSSSENVTMKYAAGTRSYNLVLEDETDSTVRIQLGLDYVSNDGLISALVYTRNEALGGGHSDGVRIHISSAF
ncbi:MAG: autotransporter outer membrane beta-barrel domain-containing protein [Gammaproteobacteria bacterium]|nr:autotransporter outer membrane beta-barrel domain-containing protein [Gammaproteobacteria bacterium]